MRNLNWVIDSKGEDNSQIEPVIVRKGSARSSSYTVGSRAKCWQVEMKEERKQQLRKLKGSKKMNSFFDSLHSKAESYHKGLSELSLKSPTFRFASVLSRRSNLNCEICFLRIEVSQPVTAVLGRQQEAPQVRPLLPRELHRPVGGTAGR